METERRLTQEEVDREIKSLKKRFDEGKEDQSLYELKIANLKTVKALVIKGETEWKIPQKS